MLFFVYCLTFLDHLFLQLFCSCFTCFVSFPLAETSKNNETASEPIELFEMQDADVAETLAEQPSPSGVQNSAAFQDLFNNFVTDSD